MDNSNSQLKPETEDIEEVEELIDLDLYLNSSVDIMKKWDKLLKEALSDIWYHKEQKKLFSFMDEYATFLKTDAVLYDYGEATHGMNIATNRLLSKRILRQIHSIYLCYRELKKQGIVGSTYFEKMEEIILNYCRLRCREIVKYGRQGATIRETYMHFCNIMHVYLIESSGNNIHIFHVLMKLICPFGLERNNCTSIVQHCRPFLELLFSQFIQHTPLEDFSDESFCRYYMAMLSWKALNKPEDHRSLEIIVFRKFKRRPSELRRNRALNQILVPRCRGMSDVVFGCYLDRSAACIKEYFRHMDLSTYKFSFSLKKAKDKAVADRRSKTLLRNKQPTETINIDDEDDNGKDSDIEEVACDPKFVKKKKKRTVISLDLTAEDDAAVNTQVNSTTNDVGPSATAPPVNNLRVDDDLVEIISDEEDVSPPQPALRTKETRKPVAGTSTETLTIETTQSATIPTEAVEDTSKRAADDTISHSTETVPPPAPPPAAPAPPAAIPPHASSAAVPPPEPSTAVPPPAPSANSCLDETKEVSEQPIPSHSRRNVKLQELTSYFSGKENDDLDVDELKAFLEALTKKKQDSNRLNHATPVEANKSPKMCVTASIPVNNIPGDDYDIELCGAEEAAAEKKKVQEIIPKISSNESHEISNEVTAVEMPTTNSTQLPEAVQVKDVTSNKEADHKDKENTESNINICSKESVENKELSTNNSTDLPEVAQIEKVTSIVNTDQKDTKNDSEINNDVTNIRSIKPSLTEVKNIVVAGAEMSTTNSIDLPGTAVIEKVISIKKPDQDQKVTVSNIKPVEGSFEYEEGSLAALIEQGNQISEPNRDDAIEHTLSDKNENTSNGIYTEKQMVAVIGCNVPPKDTVASSWQRVETENCHMSPEQGDSMSVAVTPDDTHVLLSGFVKPSKNGQKKVFDDFHYNSKRENGTDKAMAMSIFPDKKDENPKPPNYNLRDRPKSAETTEPVWLANPTVADLRGFDKFDPVALPPNNHIRFNMNVDVHEYESPDQSVQDDSELEDPASPSDQHGNIFFNLPSFAAHQIEADDEKFYMEPVVECKWEEEALMEHWESWRRMQKKKKRETHRGEDRRRKRGKEIVGEPEARHVDKRSRMEGLRHVEEYTRPSDLQQPHNVCFPQKRKRSCIKDVVVFKKDNQNEEIHHAPRPGVRFALPEASCSGMTGNNRHRYENCNSINCTCTNAVAAATPPFEHPYYHRATNPQIGSDAVLNLSKHHEVQEVLAVSPSLPESTLVPSAEPTPVPRTEEYARHLIADPRLRFDANRPGSSRSKYGFEKTKVRVEPEAISKGGNACYSTDFADFWGPDPRLTAKLNYDSENVTFTSEGGYYPVEKEKTSKSKCKYDERTWNGQVVDHHKPSGHHRHIQKAEPVLERPSADAKIIHLPPKKRKVSRAPEDPRQKVTAESVPSARKSKDGLVPKKMELDNYPPGKMMCIADVIEPSVKTAAARKEMPEVHMSNQIFYPSANYNLLPNGRSRHLETAARYSNQSTHQLAQHATSSATAPYRPVRRNGSLQSTSTADGRRGGNVSRENKHYWPKS